MTNDEKRAILADLINLSGIRQQQPGDITVRDFAQAAGMPEQHAFRKLEHLHNRGVLEKGNACRGTCGTGDRFHSWHDKIGIQYICRRCPGGYLVPCNMGRTQLAALRDLPLRTLPSCYFRGKLFHRKSLGREIGRRDLFLLDS